MLHGLIANHTMFGKQVDYFKEKYNVIVWDAPAHGKSRPYSDFTYENTVTVMLKILNELQIKKVVLIGQSMGGYMAQSFIARHPEMIQGFVSIDSTPFGDYYSKSDIWWLKQIEWMCKPFSENYLRFLWLNKMLLQKLDERICLKWLVAMKNRTMPLDGDWLCWILDDNKELQISCPSLILVGERDNTGKVKQYNKAWSKRTGIKLFGFQMQHIILMLTILSL